MLFAGNPKASAVPAASAVRLAIAAGAAAMLGGAIVAVAPGAAHATPAFTAQTKLPCTRCHTSIPGSAQNLTDFGKQFHDNGNKLPK